MDVLKFLDRIRIVHCGERHTCAQGTDHVAHMKVLLHISKCFKMLNNVANNRKMSFNCKKCRSINQTAQILILCIPYTAMDLKKSSQRNVGMSENFLFFYINYFLFLFLSFFYPFFFLLKKYIFIYISTLKK